MTLFRTELQIPRSGLQMALSDRILTVGSCFADAIATRMNHFKMPVTANPGGILYSPTAIHRLLHMAASGDEPADHGYIAGDTFFHYDFHSTRHAASKTGLQGVLHGVLAQCQAALKEAQWLILTYGTSWEYRRLDNGYSVANCHKQPASRFSKNLLGVDDIRSSFQQLHRQLRKINPDLKVIMTISPVRHVKDTLEGNSVSKAMLRVACQSITSEFDNVFYFPAYEIVMDDLRDYRFYKADMIHPSEVAEDYIWDKFANAWLNDELLVFINSWKSILQALHHRPFQAGTPAHRKFLQSTLSRIEAWSSLVDVGKEREQLLAQLALHPDNGQVPNS